MKERIAVKCILLLSRRLKRVRQFCKSVPFTSLQLSNLKTTGCKGKSPSCLQNKFSLCRTADWTITELFSWVTSFLQNGQKADSYSFISRNHVLTFFDFFLCDSGLKLNLKQFQWHFQILCLPVIFGLNRVTQVVSCAFSEAPVALIVSKLERDELISTVKHQKGLIMNVYHTGWFFLTGPPHFQYQNKKKLALPTRNFFT